MRSGSRARGSGGRFDFDRVERRGEGGFSSGSCVVEDSSGEGDSRGEVRERGGGKAEGGHGRGVCVVGSSGLARVGTWL